MKTGNHIADYESDDPYMMPHKQTDFDILEMFGCEQIKKEGSEEKQYSGYQYSFILDGQEMTIQDYEISLDMSLDYLKANSIWWSCCGAELDHDIMICPICKEHN